MGLKILKKGRYKNLSEILTAVYKELERLQPVDSTSIKHSITSSGVVSVVVDAPTSARRQDETESETQQMVYLSHQFKVTDTSVGEVKSVNVINGNTPESSIAGTLNGVDYLTTGFTFPATDATYYIYAVDGNIYALKHRFHSDLIPALLIGVVTLAGGMVTVEQRSFEDNPTVNVLGAVNGAVTLNYTLNYANYTLTSSYTASAKMTVNDTIIELSSTAIPANANGELTGYIESLTVPFNTSPVAGIVFGNAPDNAEWTSVILNYKYDSEEFRVLSFMENPWNFTFSRFPLNAVEAGE